MGRLRLKTALVTVVVLATAAVAWAFYSTTGAGGGTGAVGSFTAPTISVPAVSTGTHAVAWDQQASLSDSSKNSQITYFVERKLGSGSFEEISSGPCDGPLPHGTTSCTDTVGTSGNYTYRAVAKYKGWTADSNEAGAVAVTVGTGPAQPTSVALANGGGVGNAFINEANENSVDVTVGLGSTSLATDTVHVTITDGTHTTTDKTAPATTGSGGVTVTGIDASALDDGSVTLRATASNATGTSPTTTQAVTKDAAEPVSSASSPQYANSAPIEVTYAATDTSGSGVAQVELWARKGSSGAFALVATDTDLSSASFSFTPTEGEGTYEFYTRATDAAANYEDAPGTADDSTIHETSKPSSSAGTVPSITNSNTFSVPYAASDAGAPASGLAKVELYVDSPTAGTNYVLAATDSSPSASGESLSYTGATTDGTYSFYTIATDVAGNVEDAPGAADATATRTTIPVQMATGTYVGNATDNRAITGLPFQPDVVIVKASSASQIAVIRTSTMPSTGSNTKPMTGTNALEVGIKTLTSDGFTLGTGNRVNANGTTYQWSAFKASAGVLSVGTYTGNNSNPRSITGVGFQPEYVAVVPASTAVAVQRYTGMSNGFAFMGAGVNNSITALGTDGFTVNSAANASTVAYHYIAFNEVSNTIKVSQYAGDNTASKTIAGLGFQPDYVMVKGDNNNDGFLRPASLGGTTSLLFPAGTNASTGITALNSDGFVVGGAAGVNGNNNTYYYLGIRNYTG